MSFVGDVCQGLLIAVLGVSATSKLRSKAIFDDFVQSLRSAGLVPAGAICASAVGLIAVEALTVPLLAMPSTRKLGFIVAALLFGVLTAGVAAIVRRGQHVTCRCFGASTVPLVERRV